MKHASLAIVTLMCVVHMASAGDDTAWPAGTQVPYVCNLHLVRATPSDEIFPDRDDRGQFGQLLRQWQVIEISEHVYEITGKVIGANAGFVEEDAAVLIGNIEVNDTLWLVAKTDKKGGFSLRIDNRTFAQVKKEAEAKKGVYVTRLDKTRPPLDQESIYRNHKYLYVGKSGDKLRRYEIPYKKAKKKVLHGNPEK